ncbi:MAG: DNA repair protein RecN, partial [Deltaproteobacteria bacterium]
GTLQRLKRRYGGSLEAVLSHLESVEDELAGIENISGEISETEKRLSKLKSRLIHVAEELSEKRRHIAEILSEKVEKELSTLKMSQTKFKIQLQHIPINESTEPYLMTDGNALGETGMDRTTFLIAPNIGESLKPLARIASGGELSRVVLALKAILAQTESVETVIFDEVDAGIGGSTAEVVGRKLSSLADYHQVICITHLPQIAKFGDRHFKISKHVSDGRTLTTIDPLDEKDRVREIARMLGGAKMTQVTLDHATEMLQEK